MASNRHMKPLDIFPSNVPQPLIDAYKGIVKIYGTNSGSCQRKLAAHLGVNMKYLNDLLVKGIEPTNRTKKGRAAREKLFLPVSNMLDNKEDVIETLESLVKQLNNTIRRLRE
jgi:predicted RecB family endonuclease